MSSFLLFIQKAAGACSTRPIEWVTLAPHHEGGVWYAFWWPNLIICCLDRCADVSSSTWCGACRHIMIELSLVIDYLWFFFLLSLLRIKVHICPLFICCLPGSSMTNGSKFVGSDMDAKPKARGLTWPPDPKTYKK
jgi:hypothetical protein